ncbi:hypothetical protein THAOC_10870, partial [Thalassiosira oceanica]
MDSATTPTEPKDTMAEQSVEISSVVLPTPPAPEEAPADDGVQLLVQGPDSGSKEQSVEISSAVLPAPTARDQEAQEAPPADDDARSLVSDDSSAAWSLRGGGGGRRGAVRVALAGLAVAAVA